MSIENVQRRATKMVPALKHMSCEDRLRTLGLPTLLYRRERADMIQVFKALNKFEAVVLENMEIAANANRGHKFKLSKSHTRSRFGQNRFTNRIVNGWNGLSAEAVEAKTVNAFKGALNRCWKDRDGKFSCQWT